MAATANWWYYRMCHK